MKVLVVTVLLNDVNKRRFSHGMTIKLQVERLRQSTNVLRVTNEDREQLLS